MVPNLKAAMMVNVASVWGLTNLEYTELTQLREKYHSKGFEVFAFPSNEHGGQEPDSAASVEASMKQKYGANFVFMAKENVSVSPVFIYLLVKSK